MSLLPLRLRAKLIRIARLRIEQLGKLCGKFGGIAGDVLGLENSVIAPVVRRVRIGSAHAAERSEDNQNPCPLLETRTEAFQKFEIVEKRLRGCGKIDSGIGGASGMVEF